MNVNIGIIEAIVLMKSRKLFGCGSYRPENVSVLEIIVAIIEAIVNLTNQRVRLLLE